MTVAMVIALYPLAFVAGYGLGAIGYGMVRLIRASRERRRWQVVTTPPAWLIEHQRGEE